MTWVRLDDGYPEHPKVDRVGPLAAWLNVCAWAYSARNLTDGFVPAERVNRLADVKEPGKLAATLVAAGLWEPAGAACEKCADKRGDANAVAAAGSGYLVHDYLEYNPSREDVLAERAAAAKRAADYRARRTSGVTNGVTHGVIPDVTNGVSDDVMHAVTAPVSDAVSPGSPYTSPVNATNVASRAAKPNRSAEVIDALRAKGIEPTMTPRDHAAMKASTASVQDIADVYEVVFQGRYGDQFMQKRLSVHEAIGWIDGYKAWKQNGAPRPTRTGQVEQPRRLIDKTGVEN